MTSKIPLQELSNNALLEEAVRLAARERGATAALIAAIAEVDARRLYLGESCSSMFVYCTRVLHLSEHAAYDRIEAARLSRRFPALLMHMETGALTLTNVRLLGPHLTHENADAVMSEAAHKSRMEVERLIARMRPQPDAPAAIRKLPERTPSTLLTAHEPFARVDTAEAARLIVRIPPTAQAKPPVIKPLAPERYKVQFTISDATREKLRRVQDLMRHTIPNGDLSAIFDRAVTVLLEDLEKRRAAATKSPRATRAQACRSRHIPASVRREVWKRDGGRCAFVGSNGRCTETGFLELHHVQPFAAGGRAVAENIELRCRAHNAYEAELFFSGSVVREVWPGWGVETGPGTSSAPTRDDETRDRRASS
jgi:hypothetical protein